MLDKHLRSALMLSVLFALMANCDHNAETDFASASSPNSVPYRIIVVEQGLGQVKWFRSDGTLTDSVQVGYNPHEIELDRNAERAYVSNFGVEDYDNTLGIPGNTLSVLDLQNRSLLRDWPTFRAQTKDTCKAPHGVKLRPPAFEELYVNAEYGDSMLIYDITNGRIKRSFPIARGNHNFEFSPSGDTLWLMAGNNGVFQYQASSGLEIGRFPVSSPVRGLIFTRDRKKLLLSCQNEIYILDPVDLRVIRHFTDLGVGQIIYSCLNSEEDRILAPCPYDDLVLVIDMESGAVVRLVPTGKAPIYVRLDPAGREAFVANALDDHMSVINMKDYSVRPFGKVFKPNGFAFLTP